MGNGTLLATFGPTGELAQVFAPSIDALHSCLGTFLTSLLIPARPGEGGHRTRASERIFLKPESFEIRMQLASGMQTLQVEYRHRSGPLRIQRTWAVHPTEPLLIDRWQVLESGGDPVGLLHESVPWMGQSTSAHCSLIHPGFNGVVHYRGASWVGVLAQNPIRWARVGHLPEQDRYRLWDGEKVLSPLAPADLPGFDSSKVRSKGDQVVQGAATWGAFVTGPGPAGDALDFFVVCAGSEKHLGELLAQVKGTSPERHFERIESHVNRRHSPAQAALERISHPRVRWLCERSIDVLHALQDSRGGALMAAAELDPHCRLCGGYGYSWPRDGAYLALALGAFGFRDRVEHYFRFLAETQEPGGAWPQRTLATGHAGPAWGRIQIDETATPLVSAWNYYRHNQDLFWLENSWPMIERALGFLDSFHSAENPLGLPATDLWEEREGIHAYSLASVAAAFRCGAVLARELSNRAAQVHWHRRSRELLRELRGRFLPGAGPLKRTQRGDVCDETLDASLLGLITPFHLLRKRDPAMHRILDQVRERLWSADVGGVHRYEGDLYRGGNPWVLTTLWLGQAELARGRTEVARECFLWALSKVTSLGMLPEQVHRETGYPYWVIPLGWSHAMFLLFVREVVDRGLQNEIFAVSA